MSLWIIWVALAAILLIIEVCTQMLWTLCIAVGCLFALLADWLGVTLEWQLVIIAITSVVTYIVMLPVVRRWHERQSERRTHASRTGMDALLGRRGIVTHEIKPEQPGRIRIDGDSWQAVIPKQHETVRKGAEVVVTDYDSIILTVTPYPEHEKN